MSPLDLLTDCAPWFLLVLLIGIALGYLACKWMHPRPPTPTWEQRQFTRN